MPQGPSQSNVALNAANKSAPLQMDASGNLLVGNGSTNKLNITAATVVKATAGRICTVVVNVAGAAGTLNDCATTGAAAAANLIFAIPATVGVYKVDFPCLAGIVVAPGAAQVVSVSFD